MEPLRVLVVKERLRHAGGIVASLLEVLPRLPELGVVPSIVVFKQQADHAHAAFEAAGIPVVLLPETTLPSRVRALRRTIVAESIDVVHSSQTNAHLPSRLAARLARVPELTSLVNRPPAGPERGVPSWRGRTMGRLDRWSARHLTDRFHSVSHATATSWIDAVGIPGSRVTVVERGRDPDRFVGRDAPRRVRTRAERGIAPDAEVVLNVARQHRQKGQVDLVAAFALLARERPAAVLVIVGDEQDAHEDLVEQCTASPYRDRIHLLPYRTDVPDLLNAADVFAFPSRYEGLGGASIEAMAACLPRVVADIPVMHEVAVDGLTGLIVDCRDHAAFAAALARVLDDSELARSLADRAHAEFLQRFTIDRCAARMAELYRSVAAREPATPIGDGRPL